jgi:alkylation response protein AidB-like acyl-CoA dehydrogenase
MTAVTAMAVRGADPALGLHRATVAVDVGLTAGADRTWDDAVAAGRLAVGHQIAGATRAMLDLARTHALDRVQFGRPIARFQAVRHRLAEALVAIEGLEATLGAAWDDGTPMTAALAKAAAGRTARTVGAQCQQVLAGIGFTTDHPFHLYLKRTMVLEGLFGTADAIVLDVGRHLVRTRSAPTLIEL